MPRYRILVARPFAGRDRARIPAALGALAGGERARRQTHGFLSGAANRVA